jgi:hypothetical protein
MSEQLLNLSRNLHPAMWNLLIILAFVTLGIVIKGIYNLILRINWIQQPDYRFIKTKILRLSRPLNFFLPVLMLNFGLKIMRVSPETFQFWNRIFEILLIIGFAAILINLFRILEEFLLYKHEARYQQGGQPPGPQDQNPVDLRPQGHYFHYRTDHHLHCAAQLS